MAIIKKTEAMPIRPVIVMIYGMPATGKTSLSNTSLNPILIDCDRGSDRSINRPDTITASKWEDILTDEAELKAFDGYNTICIDTAKAALDDYLMEYVVRTDAVAAKNSQKAYGEIGKHFKNFVNRQRATQKDIVVIAHAKEEKDGDLTKFYPDVTGGSKDLLLRVADQVGFLTVVNGKRTLYFEPTDRTIGKNVARLAPIEIPDETDVNYPTFMQTIINAVKERIQAKSAEQANAIKTADELAINIDLCETADIANELKEDINNLPKVQKLAMFNKLTAQMVKHEIIYNAEQKLFVNVQD